MPSKQLEFKILHLTGLSLLTRIFWCSLWLSGALSAPLSLALPPQCSSLTGSTHFTPLQVHNIFPLPPHFYFLYTITTCSFPFFLYILFYFHCSSFFGCCIWDLGFNVSLTFCVYHFFPFPTTYSKKCSSQNVSFLFSHISVEQVSYFFLVLNLSKQHQLHNIFKQ